MRHEPGVHQVGTLDMGETANRTSTRPADDLMAVVRELAIGLRPHRRTSLTVDLDSSLDRDLGFDSLGRAELLLRLERAFRVRLPEELLAEAETPRDLLDAALAARPGRVQLTKRAAVQPIPLPEPAERVNAQSLTEAPVAHVSSHGEREHILLWRLGTQEQVITYSELDRAPRGVAGGLLARGSDFDAGLRLRDAARAVVLARCGEPDLVREQVRPPS
jgi:acyl carrier protein